MSDASDAERAQLIEMRFGQMADRWAEARLRAFMDQYINDLAQFQQSSSPPRQILHNAVGAAQPQARKKSAFELAFGL